MTRGERMKHMDSLDVQELISQGSFGKIYRVVHKGTGEVLALKKVPLDVLSRVDRQEAIDEARMLSNLHHPHIIRHLQSFVEDNVLYILMEYAAGGTVHHVRKAGPLTESRIWKYCTQLLRAVAYTHSLRIIHRDIKTLNVFLDKDDNVKLGDFGIARALSEGTNLLQTLVGTPFYLAPELCEDKPYGQEADIWAVGVCLYEMCMGTHPFTAKNEGALIRKILKGQYAKPTGYSSELSNIISLCLTYRAQDRPCASALLARPEVLKQSNAEVALALKQSHNHKSDAQLVEQHTPNATQGNNDMQGKKGFVDVVDQPPRQKQHPFALDPINDQPDHGHIIGSMRKPGGRSKQCVRQLGSRQELKTAVADTGSSENSLPAYPEHILTAGVRNNYSDRSAPYNHFNASAPSTACQHEAGGAWTFKYERPQYARKRCPDLMVSGPSIRTETPVRGHAPKVQGLHAYEASVGSTTTYQQHSGSQS